MADYPLARGPDDGMDLRQTLAMDYGAVDSFGVNLWGLYASSQTPPVTTYKMRGMDAAVSGLYDSWLTTGAPDTDGSDYHGALAKPLRDVVVIDAWTT